MSSMAASSGRSQQHYSQWSQLPTDLLEIISKKIADIADFARFRSVCRSWRYAAKPINLSPQLPWMLLPYDPTSSSRSFFSLSTESIYNFELPETRSRNICGSSNGWFVMLNKTLNVSLFNPLTRSLIHLPPITTLPERGRSSFLRVGTNYIDRWTKKAVTIEETAFFFDCYAHLYPAPNSLIDGVVAFLVKDCKEILYWRPGDEEWTMIQPGTTRFIRSFTFYKGRFYVIDQDGNTAVCNLGPDEKGEIIPSLKLPPLAGVHYLVTLPEEGELLMVTCVPDYSNFNFFCVRETRFEYHKLEEESEGAMTWSQIEGVGDCSVFVTDGPGVYDGGKLTTAACNATGRKSNCVYYLVPSRACWRKSKCLYYLVPWRACCREGLMLTRTDLVVVEDGNLDLYSGPWKTPHPDWMRATWIVPSLN